MRVPRWFFPSLSGALFSAAWWLCIDAVARQTRYGYLPPPGPAWYLPGTIATLGAFMTAMAPLDEADNDLAYGPPRAVSWARCWVFASFVISMGALVSGVAVTLSIVSLRQETQGAVEKQAAPFLFEGPVSLREGPHVTEERGDGDVWGAAKERRFAVSVWPGVAVTAQAALILCASFSWVAAVRRRASEDEGEW